MKAGTACKLILNMISTASMVLVGKCYGNLMVDLRATSAKLVERSKRILVETLGISYASAGKLLLAAHGEVKTAIAMNLLNLDYRAAKRQLSGVEGKLSKLLQK
jgi:N-acetylmuramic acid 6-phosphate etherase